ncbi:MAG: 2-phosphosulfolactate phosphatase [Candidatus Latescibacteria bacterium]|nr:2-phosphosulfolactate phosphatase [Candidatus Latescibacterota bacterium]
MNVDLYTNPQEVSDGSLASRTVVVIDALRASTTLVTALANGCREIVPVDTVERAMATRKRIGPQGVLLCGERGGLKIQGFDLGNSPREYLPEVVAGKTLVFTSTNGSRAMVFVRGCHLGLIGAFINAGATARRILSDSAEVAIVCSGRENLLSIEDMTCGGLIVSRLLELRPEAVLNDAARTAHILYEHYAHDLLGLLKTSDHGRHLVEIGFGDDLPFCALIDTTHVVPVIRDSKVVKE